MSTMKPLVVRGRILNHPGRALICAPLVARTADAIASELVSILPKKPDVIEWRVDFFDQIDDANRVIAVARSIREAVATTPIIFTCRAPQEGGEAIKLGEDAVVALYQQVIASEAIDIIDYELGQAPPHRALLRAASRAHDVAMILSYHNFSATPGCAELVDKIISAEREGADIAKLAVMPTSPADVLVLLEATLLASARVKIPLITLSMGRIGTITRVCGGLFGSALTFAVGDGRSAPGQIAIEELRAAMATMAAP